MASNEYKMIGTTKGIKGKTQDELLKIVEKSANKESEENINKKKKPVARKYSTMSLLRLLKLNTTHKRSCEIVANDVASGFYFKPKNEESDEKQREEIEKVISSLSDDFMSEIYKVAYDYQSLGEGYFEIAVDGNRPVGIYHLPASKITMLQGGNIIAESTTNSRKSVYYKKYGYDKDVTVDTGEEKPLNSLSEDKKANCFYQIKSYDPENKYYGFPPVLTALISIESIKSAQEFNNDFFINAGQLGTLILLKNFKQESLDNAQAQVKQYIEDAVEYPHSMGAIMIPAPDVVGPDDFEPQIDIKNIESNIKDVQFNELIKTSKQDIREAHGIPSYLYGDNSESTGALGGSNSRDAYSIYKNNIVDKIQKKIELIINKILGDIFSDLQWTFKLSDVDEEDENKKLDMAIKLFEKGVLTPNDLARNFGKKFGINADEENDAMNAHYINGQNVELLNDYDSLNQMYETNEALLNFNNAIKSYKEKRGVW